MQRDAFDNGGFDPPLPFDRRRRQRTVLSLLASIALALSIVVTVTVVSIGIAQADLLVSLRSGEGGLAVILVIGCLVVGTIVGEIYRRRQQRPD
jgi:hypothetical protein